MPPEGLAFGEGEGVGFEVVPELESDPEGDAGGVLLGSAAGVNSTTLEDEVGDGWPSVRNFPRMLEASLGETVVVVVALRGLANTVTVTVTGSSPKPPLFDGEVEVVVEGLVDDVVLVELSPLGGSSEPVMPPLTPAAFIRPITVFSLVQRSDVPGARRSGMAKHC